MFGRSVGLRLLRNFAWALFAAFAVAVIAHFFVANFVTVCLIGMGVCAVVLLALESFDGVTYVPTGDGHVPAGPKLPAPLKYQLAQLRQVLSAMRRSGWDFQANPFSYMELEATLNRLTRFRTNRLYEQVLTPAMPEAFKRLVETGELRSAGLQSWTLGPRRHQILKRRRLRHQAA